MNKRLNTVLFLLLATAFNIVVVFSVFLVGFVTLGSFVLPSVSPQMGQILLIVLFVGSLVLGYVIYNRTMKWVTKRYDVSTFMEPIFKDKHTKQ